VSLGCVLCQISLESGSGQTLQWTDSFRASINPDQLSNRLAFSVCALLSKIKDIVLPSQGWLKCKHEYIDITNGSLDTVQDNQFLAFNQNNLFANGHIQISCDIIITT